MKCKEYNLDTPEVNDAYIGMPPGIDLCNTDNTIPITNTHNKMFTSPEDVVLVYCLALNVKLDSEQRIKLSMLIKECYDAGYMEGLKHIGGTSKMKGDNNED